MCDVSVRPSATLWYCIKKIKDHNCSSMESPKILVLPDRVHRENTKVFTPNEGFKVAQQNMQFSQGIPVVRKRFEAIEVVNI